MSELPQSERDHLEAVALQKITHENIQMRKVINALDDKIADLENYLKSHPQPISYVVLGELKRIKDAGKE